MKKRLFSFSLALLLLLVYAIPVFAADGETQTHDPRFVDQAGLLTESEAQELTAKLDEISERQQFEVVVVTTTDLEGKTPEAYADDYYDYHNYGYGKNKDGVLFLRYINGDSKEVHISTTGLGIKAFTDEEIQSTIDKMAGDIQGGNYAAAFTTFANEADKQATDAKKFPIKRLLIAFIIGLIVAFIVIKSVEGKYKPVRFKSNASDYLAQGSLQITGGYENFLYSNVTQTARNDDKSGGSSTHTGSSGTSHGGGGRSI